MKKQLISCITALLLLTSSGGDLAYADFEVPAAWNLLQTTQWIRAQIEQAAAQENAAKVAQTMNQIQSMLEEGAADHDNPFSAGGPSSSQEFLPGASVPASSENENASGGLTKDGAQSPDGSADPGSIQDASSKSGDAATAPAGSLSEDQAETEEETEAETETETQSESELWPVPIGPAVHDPNGELFPPETETETEDETEVETETESSMKDENRTETQSASETELSGDQSAQTEMPETGSPQAETPQTEASQTETAQTETPQTEAPQTEAPQTEAPQSEAPQTEAPQTEAPQSETPQSETGQAESETSENDETQDSTDAIVYSARPRHGIFEIPPILGMNTARINLYDYTMLREWPLTSLPKDLHLLLNELRRQTSEYEGEWSVYVQNLSTNQAMILNDTPMRSASVMKLFIMEAVYEAFDKGTLPRNEDNVYLLRSMIINSSNETTNRLITLLGDGDFATGVAKVNRFIRLHGFSNDTRLYNGFQDPSTVIDSSHTNSITAVDVGLLLSRVYNREFISRKVCNEIESMMLEQATRYKIPRGLPDGVECGNKSGETDTVANDAAVIYAAGTDYILVVLSSDWSNVDTANAQVAEVSKTVYTFFEGEE